MLCHPLNYAMGQFAIQTELLDLLQSRIEPDSRLGLGMKVIAEVQA